ncbi:MULTISPECIES: hypothetical protein [unclassified Bradyrhizobium]|uniref:hypothetical protein n=1 Tax=unclassified Bradyrhizobium TaxID=2631580 RepID=UPI00247909C3|nr:MULTISPECIES: hypothetical protein [unclassified Bradyrhizobium]WGR70198.1 hypothetical protein MTX24_33145 [Bradyrhizobium sp. ISRA426]WGR82255.1 hypothetical protein MTX21_18250 [Bradyrhizobium sp. ISRA430]WGR85441.1 hypothetical protein MTX25_32820 [Bradyrhizobium sp. ISRA432]
MGEPVPPELDYLVNRLRAINPSADARLIVEHARKINTAYQFLRGRPDKRGFKLKGDIRRRAEPVPATRGLKDDLQRLLKAARGGSAKEWQTAWLGVSGAARSMIKPPTPRRTHGHRATLDTRNMKLVNVGGLSAVIPKAQDSIPRIEAALAKGGFSSKREADKLTDIFVLRVRDAYRALAGKKGLTYRELNDTSTLDPKGGFAEAGLIALANDIDGQFGTKVLTVSRLRKKEAKMNLSAEELTELRKPWGKRTS